MSLVVQELPKDHPMIKSWDQFKTTADYNEPLQWLNTPHQEGTLWWIYAHGWQAAERQASAKRGKQTWWGSLVEAKANIIVGCAVAYVSNMIVLPLFGFDSLSHAKNFGIVLIYTGISVARQLVVRRFFNGLKWGHHK